MTSESIPSDFSKQSNSSSKTASSSGDDLGGIPQDAREARATSIAAGDNDRGDVSPRRSGVLGFSLLAIAALSVACIPPLISRSYSFEQKVVAREADLTKQIATNSSLQNENNALKESSSILEARRDELLASLEKSKRRNDILESEKMDVFELASNMQADAQRLATQNRSLNEKANAAQGNIDRLNQQLAKLQQDNVQLVSQISTFQNSAQSGAAIAAPRPANIVVCYPGVDGWEPCRNN